MTELSTTDLLYSPPGFDPDRMVTGDGDPCYLIVQREVVIETDPVDGWEMQAHPVLGLPPEGRRWECHFVTHMLRTPDAPLPEARLKFRERVLHDALSGDDREVGESGMAYIGEPRSYVETWLLMWFSHWTYDVGQSDADALASFDRYVLRHEAMSVRVTPGCHPRYHSLMGAEDRWRWKASGRPGEEPAEDATTTYDPPCRCAACRRHGVIRIDH